MTPVDPNAPTEENEPVRVPAPRRLSPAVIVVSVVVIVVLLVVLLAR